MSVGIILLAHRALDRVAQVARHWAVAGCPVVIHIDAKAPRSACDQLARDLGDLDRVVFAPRRRVDWGGWSVVRATQDAAELLLARFDDVSHVYLTSGACLPLKPVAQLQDFLARHPDTDFIESVTTYDAPWTVGGLEYERFEFFFPVSWKHNRAVFDRLVRVQRRFGVARRMPDGLVPHLGSQWWCLTRATLRAILDDPRRAAFDRYFSKVWIPDESYFQSLSRLKSANIVSRSLTLSKFDAKGKPHIFYDDHKQLLRQSDCFVARKIWPHADGLYAQFLGPAPKRVAPRPPRPELIDRYFARATEKRVGGRPGLYMQSRFPGPDWDHGKTAASYTVYQGFDCVFDGFTAWMQRQVSGRVHGHLFAPERAEFSGDVGVFAGALSDSARLRDYMPTSFLTNLVWNTKGEHQHFLFAPGDAQRISGFMATDPNARIYVISGAWAVGLYRSQANFAVLRKQAAELQKTENRFLEKLRDRHSTARFRIWTLAEFLRDVEGNLKSVLKEVAGPGRTDFKTKPQLRDLRGIGDFFQDLKNQGMLPHLAGEFPAKYD